MALQTKPKCGSKSQSCGYSCIEAKDTCHERLDKSVADGLLAAVAATGKPVSDLATATRNSFSNPGDLDKSFEELEAKYPAKKGLKATRESLGDQVTLWTVTHGATDGSSDTMRYQLLQTAAGSYTVSDSRLKEVTDVAKNAVWREALQAGLRSAAAADSRIEDIRNKTRGGDAKYVTADTLMSFLPASYGMLGGAMVDFASGGKILDLPKSRAWVADTTSSDYVIRSLVSKGLTDLEVKAASKVVSSEGPFRETLVYGNLSTDQERVAKLAGKMAFAHRRSMEGLEYIALGNASEQDEGQRLNRSETDKLFKLQDEAFVRQPKLSKAKAESELKAEASRWAKSQGFAPGGTNGFSAEATEAHDIAHPATHRLIGLNSDQIRKEFGNLVTKTGKPSLIAEEALVNAIEHLAAGDSLEASIQNGLRLARVQSRSGTDAEKAYVRTSKFANKIIDLIANKAFLDNDFTPIAQVVRDYGYISRTVTASGGNFNNSASGG